MEEARQANMSAGISSSSTALWHPQPFPYSVDDFSSDDRIYQDKVTGKYLLEEGEREYEWVESVQNWTETVSPFPLQHALHTTCSTAE